MTDQFIGDHCTRYEISVPLTYHRVNGRIHHVENGRARDLHFRGAWVELPEGVRPGSTLTLALTIPPKEVPLLAHVVWARPDSSNGAHLHGVRFTGVTPAQRERLATLFAQRKPVPLRLYCALAATCQRKGVACAATPGTTRDLSRDGMCVRLPEPVVPGTELCARIATEFGQIVADAQVVWGDGARAGLPQGASYRHGLRFLHFHGSSELPLRALLEGIH